MSGRPPRAMAGTLDKTFTAVLQQSSAKGGWTYVVTDWTRRFLRHSGPGQGRRHRRRPALPQLVHGARRRHPQAAGHRRPARRIGKGEGDTVTIHLTERLG